MIRISIYHSNEANEGAPPLHDLCYYKFMTTSKTIVIFENLLKFTNIHNIFQKFQIFSKAQNTFKIYKKNCILNQIRDFGE